jgi:hypothetical protein
MSDSATDGEWTHETPVPPVRLDVAQAAVDDMQRRVAPLWDRAVDPPAPRDGRRVPPRALTRPLRPAPCRLGGPRPASRRVHR